MEDLKRLIPASVSIGGGLFLIWLAKRMSPHNPGNPDVDVEEMLRTGKKWIIVSRGTPVVQVTTHEVRETLNYLKTYTPQHLEGVILRNLIEQKDYTIDEFNQKYELFISSNPHNPETTIRVIRSGVITEWTGKVILEGEDWIILEKKLPSGITYYYYFIKTNKLWRNIDRDFNLERLKKRIERLVGWARIYRRKMPQTSNPHNPDIKSSEETFGEWLTRVSYLESQLPLDARKLFNCDNEIQNFKKAMSEWQEVEMKYGYTEAFKEGMNTPISEFEFGGRGSMIYGYKLIPSKFEEIITWWKNYSNVVVAKKAIKELNKKIALRTGYGIRHELVKDRGHIIAWSSGARTWIVFARENMPDEEIELDANQVFAPYPYDLLMRIAGCLEYLPLYYQSLEAKERGEIEWMSANIKWLLKMQQYIAEEKLRERLK